MELVVFDLDGTLLDATANVSRHTRETLALLRERGIAYTVATGRTLHAARDLLEGHGFDLPHIYKNGVVVWRPENDSYSHTNLLTQHEIRRVLTSFIDQGVTPFIFTFEQDHRHAVYHGPLQTEAEHRLVKLFGEDRGLSVLPVAQLPRSPTSPISVRWATRLPLRPWNAQWKMKSTSSPSADLRSRAMTGSGSTFTTPAPARVPRFWS